MIELGDAVRCKYSGFKGVAVSRTEFINGCVQFGVLPKVKKDGTIQDDVGIDEEGLEVIKKKTKTRIPPLGGYITRPKFEKLKKPPGGANRKGPSMTGY